MPPHSSKAVASTVNTTDGDNEPVKSESSNEESRKFKIFFNVEDFLLVVGELGIWSTKANNKLVNDAPVFRVWNNQGCALGGIILVQKKVEVVDQVKKKDVHV